MKKTNSPGFFAKSKAKVKLPVLENKTIIIQPVKKVDEFGNIITVTENVVSCVEDVDTNLYRLQNLVASGNTDLMQSTTAIPRSPLEAADQFNAGLAGFESLVYGDIVNSTPSVSSPEEPVTSPVQPVTSPVEPTN